MRDQGYNNVSNMKVINQGVQNKLWSINPKEFYSACGCHSMNLILCDMENSFCKPYGFFAYIQYFLILLRGGNISKII